MNFPIVIISTWRTGSTSYGTYLSDKHEIPFYSEPFASVDNQNRREEHHKTLLDFLIKFKSNETNYIIKFMICDIDDLSPYKNVLKKSCYLIRLMRKDVVSQIASHYIAKYTKNFHEFETDITTNTYIPIDQKLLRECFRVGTRNNWLLQNCSLPWNETIWYEDLGFIKNSMRYRINHKPQNYEEIKQKIISLMKWN